MLRVIRADEAARNPCGGKFSGSRVTRLPGPHKMKTSRTRSRHTLWTNRRSETEATCA